MTVTWRVLAGRLESLGSRLVFVVCATLAITAGATLASAAWFWSRSMEALQRTNFVEAIGDIHDRLGHDSGAFDRRLHHFGFRHYAPEPYAWPRGRHDVARLSDAVAAQFGATSDPHVVRVDDRARCIQPPSLHLHEHLPEFGCWYVRFRVASGAAYALEIDRDAVRNFNVPLLVPTYVAVIGVESILLAIVLSRLTLAPLRRLSEASQSFARSLDPALLPETGPREIRLALRTFNVMQERVRDGFAARTSLLASISHDLQTPLTRMRIRLEQVEDATLRDRLLADLGIMMGMVRGGLELAASGENREPWATVELGALLETLATDAQEIGQTVTCPTPTTLRARVKPNALLRALQNLCENAVKHAGGAFLRAETSAGEIRIVVEDRGPGLPPHRLEAVFTPFVRGAGRREGTGLGLAIARAQAATFGAQITLENQDGGGLRATLALAAPDGTREAPDR